MTDEEILVLAHNIGFTIREIKSGFHFGSSKISRVINDYKRTGQIPKKPKIGAPTNITNDVLLKIHQLISGNARISLMNMSIAIQEQLKITISPTTVQKGCKQLRYSYKPPQLNHNLTEVQKRNRILFARTMILMAYNGQIDLRSIVFSDESRFVLGDDKQWVWRRYGERNPTAVRSLNKFPLA